MTTFLAMPRIDGGWLRPSPVHPAEPRTDHAHFGLDELARDDHDDVIVSATLDETDPQNGKYASDTAEHWRYFGKRARQSWRVSDPDPRLEVLVNGRHCYWASRSPIPGGTSYENFEILEPFRQGRELVFGIEPLER